MATRKIWHAKRAVLPDGEKLATIVVGGGTMVGILERDAPQEADEEVIVPDDQALASGLVDIHVHVSEPGRTEWEGHGTATRAAAAGGFTTLVDMPLNSSPCTTLLKNPELKKEAAHGKLSMDAGFWGDVIPGSIQELRPMWEAGVFGFKCFLGGSGLDEYPYVDRPTLLTAMKEIASFGDLLIIHAGDTSALDSALGCDGRFYEAFMNSHPAEAGNASVDSVVGAVRQTGCHAHILHLNSAGAVDSIRRAKVEGLPLTVGTAPRYLTFDAEKVPDGATEYKCCPPLHGHANRMGLWKAFQEGVISPVALDHSPSTVELKHLDTGDFGAAWGGVSSAQLGFSAVWTEGRKLGASLSDVARWQGSNPTAVVGFAGRGSIEVGTATDLIAVTPDETFVVDKDKLFHKNPVSPYHGRELAGVVKATWLAGEPVESHSPACGREITRGNR